MSSRPRGAFRSVSTCRSGSLKTLAAICLKRFEARGGEILVPASFKLTTCHYKENQFLVTRVDTEVVAGCGEEHLTRPTAFPG